MTYIVLGTDCVSAHGDELYPFLTAEAAYLFADILNRDQAKHYTPPGISFHFTPQGSTAANFGFETYFRSADRTVVSWDQHGVITKLDLPYIAWLWLRTTAPARVAKALWKGWA